MLKQQSRVRQAVSLGQAVSLIRSGHSPRSPERGIVVDVLGAGHRAVLRVRWCEGRETFVPVSVVDVP